MNRANLDLSVSTFLLLITFFGLPIFPQMNNGTTGYGILFENKTTERMAGGLYTETMHLNNLSDKTQAFQFRLLFNKSEGDSTILIFQDIQKASDLADESWQLSYNVVKGSLLNNGASQDEVLVLVYNLNQNNGLLPGSYKHLLKVNYKAAFISGKFATNSSIQINNAEASTYRGFPVDITPSENKLNIEIKDKASFLGDVNSDGYLNLKDLVTLINVINGIEELTDLQMMKGDIAPWNEKDDLPSPDYIIDANDLSVLRNIILTNHFPDGTELNSTGTGISAEDSEVTSPGISIYINHKGITIYSDLDEEVSAAQFSFAGLFDNSCQVAINSEIGEGYSFINENNCSVILYNQQANELIKKGLHLLADIPVNISDPDKVILKYYSVTNQFKNDIAFSKVIFIYGSAPAIPSEFKLYQNFPNPFNPATTIRFSIPDEVKITLTVFDVLGKQIKVLVNEEKARGSYDIKFNASDLASGIYFYRFTAGDFISTHKMMLIR